MTSPADAAHAITQSREHIATDLTGFINQHWPAEAAAHQLDRLSVYFHLDNLTEALTTNNSAIFVDYARWLEVVFHEAHVPIDSLPAVLGVTRQVIATHIDPASAAIAAAYIDEAQTSLSAPIELPVSFISEDDPLAGLAAEYLAALLDTHRHRAAQLILAAVADGIPVRDLYLHVFQVTQREIGRLWQINRIAVAQEHYCTAATQFIMSQLYPHIFSTERIGHSMVATSISGDLHELGVRMVADFFEMAGWDTYYLGANTPINSIISEVVTRRADILAVSATTQPHVTMVRTLIDRVREAAIPHPVRILVGGQPFNTIPDLWQLVGADGSASDAQGAVALANRLVGWDGTP